MTTNQDSPNTAGAAEIKACPFCGDKAAHHERHNPMSKWRHSVDCTTCGMSGPVEATKAEAIAAWNTRADNPPQRPSTAPDEIVGAVAKAAIDRAIARLQNLRDYAGRPAWDEVIRQEMRTALTAAIPLIRAQAVAEIVAWLRADAAQTEIEAARIIENTSGNARKNAAEWAMLVRLKRGIADAIERGSCNNG